LAIIKKTSAGGDVEGERNPHTLLMVKTSSITMENSMETSQKTKNKFTL
jgi:hypothetical protein